MKPSCETARIEIAVRIQSQSSYEDKGSCCYNSKHNFCWIVKQGLFNSGDRRWTDGLVIPQHIRDSNQRDLFKDLRPEDLTPSPHVLVLTRIRCDKPCHLKLLPAITGKRPCCLGKLDPYLAHRVELFGDEIFFQFPSILENDFIWSLGMRKRGQHQPTRVRRTHAQDARESLQAALQVGSVIRPRCAVH